MNEERIYILAEKELAGQLQGEESAELERLLDMNSGNRATYEEARMILSDSAALFAGIDPQTDASWEALLGEMGEVEEEETPVLPMRRKPYGWAAVAAAIALLVGLGIFFADSGGTGKIDGPSTLSYSVGNGKIQSLTLADNSHIVLNAGSKLELAADFGKNTRTVSLEGEAYFDIARDESKPFVIQTASGTETRVLGTSFNIRAYPGQENVEIDVMSGLVSFSSKTSGETMQLKANEGAKCRIADGHLNGMAAETVSKAEWRSGKLVFLGTPLVDALVILEKHYDLQFEAALETQEVLLTATYDTRSIDEEMLVNNLRTTLGVNIEKKGRRVSIGK